MYISWDIKREILLKQVPSCVTSFEQVPVSLIKFYSNSLWNFDFGIIWWFCHQSQHIFAHTKTAVKFCCDSIDVKQNRN